MIRRRRAQERSRQAEHLCHAQECDTPVPHKMFMCRHHWFMVPEVDQNIVWDLYEPGQEQGQATPSQEYIEETQRIIEELVKREKHSD